ncbi:uncharacterized protein AB675_941 [Cyphellophora attinorum]|uniref:Uncharacterized protein n=1 Tax=Cyphellophora attinorum TaxID=1664694 RepID=A0A0N1P3S5_9EURO|nr:uncharacterized protein AB675_941 [Phialophora attinorum]KPI45730.1 hypothetical protein AB675_941 [Phialophora attinorum]
MAPFRFQDLPPEIRLNVYQQLEPRFDRGIIILLRGPPRSSGELFRYKRLARLAEVEAVAAAFERSRREAFIHQMQIDMGWALPDASKRIPTARAMFNLSRSCRLMRQEILRRPVNHMDAADIDATCVFGVMRPFFAELVCDLRIAMSLTMAGSERERWFRQLLSTFPGLSRVEINIRFRKDAETSSTKYRVNDLRMIKFILDNSNFDKALLVVSYSNKLWGRFPRESPIYLVTEEHCRQMPTLYRHFPCIAVEDELAAALSVSRKRTKT